MLVLHATKSCVDFRSESCLTEYPSSRLCSMSRFGHLVSLLLLPAFLFHTLPTRRSDEALRKVLCQGHSSALSGLSQNFGIVPLLQHATRGQHIVTNSHGAYIAAGTSCTISTIIKAHNLLQAIAGGLSRSRTFNFRYCLARWDLRCGVAKPGMARCIASSSRHLLNPASNSTLRIPRASPR